MCTLGGIFHLYLSPKEWLIKFNYALVPHLCVLKVLEGKQQETNLNLEVIMEGFEVVSIHAFGN